MYLILAALLLSSFSFAESKCKVFIPVKEFNNSGITIRFDFDQVFAEKNYTEVETKEESDHEIVIEGIEQMGSFHRAVGSIQMGELKVSESVICYTQYCAISDYGKAFSRSWKKFSKALPVCR